MQTTARNASLTDLRDILLEQQGAKVDMVVPASKMAFSNGNLIVAGVDPQITAEGVTLGDGVYRPTVVFDEGIADKFKIPLGYVRRLRQERPDLYDANVNGWLRDETRSFLVRTFRGDDIGIGRSFHSDRYKTIDNYDILVAILDGLRQAGVRVEVDRSDLTDRRMYLRIVAPEVEVYAREMLKGYRSPFGGGSGTDLPIVFAGIIVSNSETGSGAFTIKPQVIVKVCSNGQTITEDVMRSVHLGGRLEEGVVQASQETLEKTVALVTSRTKDAVRTFFDVDYMTAVVARLEEKSSVRVNTETVQQVIKKMSYTQEQAEDVFAMFVEGGQMTAGGVMSAISASAQNQKDADVAHAMEDDAIKAMELAAA